MKKINGYLNEYEFVKILNNKKINELDPLSKDLIYKIFNNINENDIIKCWKNHYDQKGDILININGAIKSISIKMGAKNSVHAEHLHYFISFLKENKIPLDIIKLYLEYHFADGTLSGKGQNRLSVSEYKENNQYKIDKINEYLNNEIFIKKCVERFILRGTNCDYFIAGMICGTPNNYYFMTKDEIINCILNKKNIYSTGVHVSSLSIQPIARDLNYTGKYEKERFMIQVKWFNIFEDIMEYYYKELK